MPRISWVLAAWSVALVAACLSKPDRPGGSSPDGPATDAVPSDGRSDDVCTADRCTGGTCDSAGFCVITGGGEPVHCPPGLKCRVNCTGGKCKMGVFCDGATACVITCTGKDACKDHAVDCGNASTCNVECNGDRACEGSPSQPVQCRASLCEVHCNGDNACKAGVSGSRCGVECCNSACAGGIGTCTALEPNCP